MGNRGTTRKSAKLSVQEEGNTYHKACHLKLE